MLGIIVLGCAAFGFTVLIAFLYLKDKKEHHRHTTFTTFAAKQSSESQFIAQEDLISRARKSITRFIKSRLFLDIVPSIACLAITSRWLALHEAITERERKNDGLWRVLLSLSTLSSCVYLVIHNMGRDITFFPGTLRTTTELVVYNATRSAFHGLNITLLLTVLFAQAGLRFSPGFSVHHGLHGYPADFARQNMKAWLYVTFIWLLWTLSSAIAMVALRRDILTWERKGSSFRDIRKLQKEEDNLNLKIHDLSQKIAGLEEAGWNDTEVEFKNFAVQELESAQKNLMRMKSLVAAMPMRIAAIRAKTD